MRLAVAQIITGADVAANLELIRGYATRAKAAGAELVLVAGQDVLEPSGEPGGRPDDQLRHVRADRRPPCRSETGDRCGHEIAT